MDSVELILVPDSVELCPATELSAPHSLAPAELNRNRPEPWPLSGRDWRSSGREVRESGREGWESALGS